MTSMIALEIYMSFGKGLQISPAITGRAFSIIKSFLKGRVTYLVYIGQSSEAFKIGEGIPTTSLLILFSFYFTLNISLNV